jgi:hypothetical protein
MASVLENFPLGSGSYITNARLLSREYRDAVRYRWDGRPSPAAECATTDAIAVAAKIMAKIDARWPRPDVV